MYDDIQGQIEKVTAYLHLGEVTIDTPIFKLHYVASVAIFVVYSLIVTIGTYAGDPIDCKTNHPVGKKFENFLDDYCFTHGTTSLKWPRMGVTHPTVGYCYEDKNKGEFSSCYESHPHYMWIPLVVLLQAFISYLPHFLWYHWEGGKMKSMLARLLDRPKFFSKKVVTSRDTVCHDNYDPNPVYKSGNQLTEELARDYLDSIGDNSFYALKYTVAEILCLVTSILQIVLTDKFLNNSFLNYGSSVVFHLSEDPYRRVDPMARTLPIVTMCKFTESFGTGGKKRLLDAICVLPNNIVHQKFYLFLWFWLIFLVTASVLLLLYRVALYLVPSFRSYVTNKVWAVIDETEQSSENRLIRFVDNNTCYSDWIILTFFHSNLTTVNFQNFTDDLAFHWKSDEYKRRN